jgi:hypothetical protein
MIRFFKEILAQPSLLFLPSYELKLVGYLLLLSIPAIWLIGVVVLVLRDFGYP